MKSSDYHTAITVHATAEQALTAINSIEKWWTENSEGSLQQLNDEFTVHFGETYITLKVTELIAAKKIVWLVTDCNKHWLKNKKEWKGTQIHWEISRKNNETRIDFMHLGLVPALECYGACENAWTGYLHNSLVSLINTGKGQPELKEGRIKN